MHTAAVLGAAARPVRDPRTRWPWCGRARQPRSLTGCVSGRWPEQRRGRRSSAAGSRGSADVAAAAYVQRRAGGRPRIRRRKSYKIRTAAALAENRRRSAADIEGALQRGGQSSDSEDRSLRTAQPAELFHSPVRSGTQDKARPAGVEATGSRIGRAADQEMPLRDFYPMSANGALGITLRD